MGDYEFSGSYVRSVVAALQRSPKSHAIAARLSYDAKLLWENPFGNTWQAAQPFEEIGEIATSELGESVYDELTHVTMRERIGPIVLPMLKSTLATKSPGNVLKKLNDLVKVAMRGIVVDYQAEGTHAGLVQVSYPRPVKKHVISSWLGVFRFVFDITAPGQITQSQQVNDDATLLFVISWEAPAP